MNPRLALANFGRAVRYRLAHGHWCQHVDWGDWWPCNWGDHEVRLCGDCERVEKRSTAVPLGPFDDDA